MKLRLKFGSQFKVAEVDEESLLGSLVEKAASLFNLTTSNVLVSLNATDFYASSDGRLKLKDIGIVSGDIIYVQSLVQSDDIRKARSSEAFEKLSDSVKELKYPLEELGVRIGMGPLDVSARSKSLMSPCVAEATSELVRIAYAYCYGDDDVRALITFTIFSCGDLMSYAASVANSEIRKQIAIKYDNFFVDPQRVDADSRGSLSVIYKNPQDLIIKLSDELIEPILVDIHEEFVLPPRFGLMNLPEAVLVNIFDRLPLGDLACVSLSSRKVNSFINFCEALWHRKLNRIVGSSPAGVINSEFLSGGSAALFGKCPSLLAFRNVCLVRKSSSRVRF